MLRRLPIAFSVLLLSCGGAPSALVVGLAPPAEAAPPAPQNDLKTGPIIDPVTFESGGATIPEAQLRAVSLAAGVMLGGDWKVLLVGLSDASGDAQANKAITQKRCDAVAAELAKFDIVHSRISEHPIGERLATDPNNARERKVEFVFYRGGDGLTAQEIAVRSRVLESDFHKRKEAAR